MSDVVAVQVVDEPTRPTSASGGPRVRFPDIDDETTPTGPVREQSALRRNPSTHNNSFGPSAFPQGSFVNNSFDPMNPLNLLKLSFVAPVSDEQALRNDLLMRLGHEPVFDNDTFVVPTMSFAAPPMQQQPGSMTTSLARASNNNNNKLDTSTPQPPYSPHEPITKASSVSMYSPLLGGGGGGGEAVREAILQVEQEPYVYRAAIRVPESEACPKLACPAPMDCPLGATAAAADPMREEGQRNDDDAAVPAAAHKAAASPPPSSDHTGKVVPTPGTSHGSVGADSPLFSAHETEPPGASSGAEDDDEETPEMANAYLNTGCFRAEPLCGEDILRERIIIDHFNGLSAPIRRLEVLEAFYGAHMAPYESNASFTGDNWDDTTSKKVNKCFELTFDHMRYCFHLTVFRRRFRIFLFSYLLRCFCVFLFWVIMFCLIPKNWFYPGGLYFDTITTILFAGICGTIASKIVGIPSIVGVIWMGLLWANVPYTGRLTKGINADIRAFIGMFGLSVGLVRAGLSLSVIRFKQKFKHYIAFSLIPMATEMVVHGVCCKAIYHYDSYKFAFAEGFLLSSIAPSVVVPIIIQYQKRGYGVRDGPSMMMLCSIAFDTASCVWGIQFLLALEFHKMSTALLIVLAPVQIIVGIVGGFILGVLVFCVTFFILISESERLPLIREARPMTLRHSVHVRYMSIGFMVIIAFTEIAVGKRFNCLGGSAVAVVFSAGTFNYLCVRGGTRDHLRVKADMAQSLTTVWDYIAMPSLFGLAGAAVNTHELFARDFIGLAFALVFISIGTRCVMAMAVPHITRLGLSWRETLFCGVGWIGKGSVQGALGGTALAYAQQLLAEATTPEEIAYANQKVADSIKMKNTAILGVLVACPICSIFLTNLTGKLLKPNT